MIKENKNRNSWSRIFNTVALVTFIIAVIAGLIVPNDIMNNIIAEKFVRIFAAFIPVVNTITIVAPSKATHCIAALLHLEGIVGMVALVSLINLRKEFQKPIKISYSIGSVLFIAMFMYVGVFSYGLLAVSKKTFAMLTNPLGLAVLGWVWIVGEYFVLAMIIITHVNWLVYKYRKMSVENGRR